jgi:hypothetical protein
MEILEAFDLTGSFRAAAELVGCSHHTVEHYVALRDAGRLPAGLEPVEREKLIDPFLDKIEEWVERSKGKIRGDVAFDKLQALGYVGSDRTVRRALARVKLNYRAGRRRVYHAVGVRIPRPSVPPLSVRDRRAAGTADVPFGARRGRVDTVVRWDDRCRLRPRVTGRLLANARRRPRRHDRPPRDAIESARENAQSGYTQPISSLGTPIEACV